MAKQKRPTAPQSQPKKQKQTEQTRQQGPALSEAELRKKGMRAFSSNSLDAAIACWSQLDQGDAQVAAALAEAYFRRALAQADSAVQVADLRQAVELVPDEVRYQYQLGLALHRAGDVVAAIGCYRAVLQQRPDWPEAGLVLALAELAQNPRVDLKSLPRTLPELAQTLARVQELLQGSSSGGALGDGPLDTLWLGLGSIAVGVDNAAAQAALDDDRPLPSARAAAVRRIYRGVAAYAAGDPATALTLWRWVFDEGVYFPAWLTKNLVTVLILRLEEVLAAGQVAEAAELARWARSARLQQSGLNALLVQALDGAAQAAAAEGKWQDAVLLWEDARQVVGSSSSLGSPRPLLHNLALAYEMVEEWTAAAEMWRAMLRTRPRTRPGEQARQEELATYTDEQWAWVRQRVIECYKRAGEPGEAVKVFRSAIKAAPDDLDMRIQLADALLANDQQQASLNELQRILNIEPRHIEAHLRMAGIYSAGGAWGAAERSLRIVLEQEPEREDVRRQIARLMLARGHYLHSANFFEQARQIFEKGAEFDPDEYQFPLNLARIAVDQGELNEMEPLLVRALELAGDHPPAYTYIIECWAVADNIEQARAVLAHAERELTLTSDFYIDVAATLLARKVSTRPRSGLALLSGSPRAKPAALDGPWAVLAREILDRAIATEPENADVRLRIASELLSICPELGIEYAEAAVKLAPDDPHVLMTLGLLQGLTERNREAKETLRRAARLARKQGDAYLADQADMLREQIGSPMLRMGLEMAMFSEAFDPDDEDDDGFPF